MSKTGLQLLHENPSSPLNKEFQLIVDIASLEIIGRLDMTIAGREARLETLYVNAEYSGRGFGNWLIGAALLQLNKYNKVSFIEANTDPKNIFALKALNAFDFFHKTSIDKFLNNIIE